jgi:hypothetical protein
MGISARRARLVIRLYRAVGEGRSTGLISFFTVPEATAHKFDAFAPHVVNEKVHIIMAIAAVGYPSTTPQ